MVAKKDISEYTIFVSIAAFNERWLQQTIDTAIESAAHSQRIFFGVGEHRTDNNFVLQSDNYKNIKHAKLQYPGLLGIGPARINAFTLYHNEDFILQVDAHMIFYDDGDNKLINRYLEVSDDTNNHKIIFSAYIPWGNIKNNQIFFSSKNDRTHIHALRFNTERPIDNIDIDQFNEIVNSPTKRGLFILQLENNQYKALAKFNQDNITSVFDGLDAAKEFLGYTNWKESGFIPYQKGRVYSVEEQGKHYKEHTGLSCHFLFTIPEFITEVGPDPLIMFSGEEHTTALRAGTRGYRIYGISDLVMWHFNKNGIDDSTDRYQLQMPDPFKKHYLTKTNNSLYRSRQILVGDILGYGGSVDSQSLIEYEQASDFNFKNFYQQVADNDKK